MKKLVMAAALVAGGTLGLQSVASAHGGQYRGPGDTVPPGGGGGGGAGAGPTSGPAGPAAPGPSGPTTPGPVAPGAPGGSANAPTTAGGGNAGADLTLWSFWWEFNKEPYLNLKSHIHGGASTTGSDSWFLGRGEKDQSKDNLRPTEEQIRQKIVPALTQALQKETNNDIVTGCLIALAKIGDASSESGVSEFQKVIEEFLPDGNQEISETAAVSLGILANPASIDLLENLLNDQPLGRQRTGRNNGVHYRTRAFAAYGLGLIGARTASADDRAKIVRILRSAIENDDTKSRDLRVACIIAMGLVPLDAIETPAEVTAAAVEAGVAVAPEASRSAQLDYLMALMEDESYNFLVRAHCPTAMARLLDGLPAEVYGQWRSKIGTALLAHTTKKSKAQREIKQSAVLALGLIGTHGDLDQDKEIRTSLAAVPKELSDQQARNYSMIAMAKVGGTPGDGDIDSGIKEAGSFLLDNLSKGKNTVKPWAGIAVGVMGRRLADANVTHSMVSSMSTALRETLDKEKDNQKIGAYAIGSGILGDIEATSVLMEKLDRTSEDEARGYLAVGLGLMNAREAIEPIQTIVKDSKYRPALLKQGAIALGLLGDKELVPDLVSMLSEAKGLATQAAISSALGFIGDQRSIDPLVAMLQNQDLTDRARGFAAVALGIVADKEPLPWNTKIAVDLNYRASTQTLVDPTGTGILDIL